MTLRRFLFLALSVACPSMLAGQNPQLPTVPQSLGLEEAIELAQRYSPTYRQTANDRGPAAWGVRNAWASTFLPSATASGSVSYSGAGSQTFLSEQFVQPSSTIGSGYSLGLSWSLSGRSLSQPGLAKSQLNAADATITGAAMDLRSAIVSQYLTVLQAVDGVTLAEVQFRRGEENLRLARARFDVGQTTILDVRQAEVARGRAEVALLQAEQAVTVEKLRLFQQIGVPAPDDPSVVTLSDTFPVVEPPWTLQELLTAAEAQNPTLRALRAQESAARWNERATKSQWLPTFTFSAGWSGFTQQFTNTDPLISSAVRSAENEAQASQRDCQYLNTALLNPGQPTFDCSVFTFTQSAADSLAQGIRAQNSVFPFDFTRQPFSARLIISLPIFTQFSRPLQISQASAQADDAREAARGRALQVRTDVSQGHYGLVTAFRTIQIQETNRTAAQEQLRLATERYRVGSGTFFELLDAQVTAQQADADYIRSRYDYHRAMAALEAAVGRSLR